jgi:hypothetical protein
MTSLETYRSLQPATREYLTDDHGMTEMKFDDTTAVVISGGEGWCDSCACRYCGGRDGCGCGDVGTVYVVENLRITEPADENGEQEDVAFDEGERLCAVCGDEVYHDSWSEAREAAREDAAERAGEARRDEGGW